MASVRKFVNGGANLEGNLPLLQVIQSLLSYNTFNFMENFLSCFCCNADVVLREVEGAPIGLYHLVCIKVKAADPKLEWREGTEGWQHNQQKLYRGWRGKVLVLCAWIIYHMFWMILTTLTCSMSMTCCGLSIRHQLGRRSNQRLAVR